MRLSTKLAATMTGLVVLAAAGVGLLSYRDLAAAILPDALDRLGRDVRHRAASVEADLRGARADVFAFRAAAAVDGIIRASIAGGVGPDGVTEREWRNRLARRFAAELEVKPNYLRLSVVGLADGGRELVSVERSNGATVVVPDQELHREGGQPYFNEALRQMPGQVFVSPIERSEGRGAPESRHVPVQRVAASLQRPDGTPFGIVAITIDLRPVFDLLRADMGRGRRIYVVNETGEFLLHPNPQREFASGAGDLLRDQFPAAADMVREISPRPRLVETPDGSLTAVAAASVNFGDNQRIIIVETLAYATIMQPAAALRQSIVLAAAAAIVVAILIALVLARSLTGPLARMTDAVQAFGRGEPVQVPLDAGGEVGVLARAFDRMAADVREKSDALMQRTEERRRLFETSVDLILVVDAKGRFTQVSPSVQTILGYGPDDLVGRNAQSLVHPDDLDDVRAQMRSARRGGSIRNFKTRYLHKDGRVVSLAWTGVWSEPAQRHFFIGRDMTEWNLEQEKFRLAVEASPNGMLMIDRDGIVVMANSESERMFGYDEGSLIGTPIDLLVPERARRSHHRLRRGYMAAPSGRRMGANRNLFGTRRDGTEFPVEVGLTPVNTPRGPLVLSVVVDISERKRVERLKDEFVSTVSHELRTPLTSIAGSLGLLTGGAAGSMSEPTMRLLKIAHKNSERLVRLINDILDIEKIESGKMTFDLKRVEVRGLVEQAIDAMRGLAENYGVRIGLAPEALPAYVQADPDRLTQVVTNLISNAVKFSPPGAEVTVSAGPHDRHVRISVLDHGPGIPDEFKPRLFEKFAQADATDARQKGGTGLGLSIVKQIVTALGGTIAHATPPDGGSRFEIELPSWDAVMAAEREAGGRNMPHILICDDDLDVARMLADQLSEAGLSADIATTGREAIAMTTATIYDAILVDLALPDCDGISLIQDLRKRARSAATPIVVISFDTSRGREDTRSASLNVLDWLDKPIDVRRLVDVLQGPLPSPAGRRTQVLHVDDDPDVRALVARSLRPNADVFSVATAEEARQAVGDRRFDLVVLDLALSTGTGLDLLPELRDRDGAPIPVIIYSAQGANRVFATQVNAVLSKSNAPFESLVALLRRHTGAAGTIRPGREREVA